MKLTPTIALAGLLSLILIGTSAIVGLTLARRDVAQVVYFLGPIASVLVPALLAALKGEQALSTAKDTAAHVERLVANGHDQTPPPGGVDGGV